MSTFKREALKASLAGGRVGAALDSPGICHWSALLTVTRTNWTAFTEYPESKLSCARASYKLVVVRGGGVSPDECRNDCTQFEYA